MAPHDPKALLDRLIALSGEVPFEVTSRPMMAGYTGYAGGRPFVSLSTGGFGIKLLPKDQERALTRPGSAMLRHSPEGPSSKSYVTFSDSDTANDDFVIEWLRLAARTAPPPKRR